MNLPVISSKHCTLMFNPDTNKIVLKDTSTNGTFVNGTLIGKNKTHEIQYNDKIRFGKAQRQKIRKKWAKAGQSPNIYAIKVPTTTKNRDQTTRTAKTTWDLALSPKVLAIEPNCEKFDDFEVSFIGDRKRKREHGDANSKRRKLSNDFECRITIHQMELTRLIVSVGVTYLPTYLLLGVMVILQVFVNPIGSCKK